jgi:hypothetical protein
MQLNSTYKRTTARCNDIDMSLVTQANMEQKKPDFK